MSTVRAQVVFQGRTGIPEDVFVNTFHFAAASGDKSAAYATLAADLEEFYTVPAAPATRSIVSFMSRFILGSASSIRFYDLDDAKPREPTILPYTWTVGSANTADLPEEVACCISYHATPPITARKRGRIYIGPLNSDTLQTAAGVWEDTEPGVGPSRPALHFRQALAYSAERLSLAAGPLNHWQIRSTRVGAAGADGTDGEAFYTIVGGYVDNAWDTQRRRGVDPSTRVLWPPSIA